MLPILLDQLMQQPDEQGSLMLTCFAGIISLEQEFGVLQFYVEIIVHIQSF